MVGARDAPEERLDEDGFGGNLMSDVQSPIHRAGPSRAQTNGHGVNTPWRPRRHYAQDVFAGNESERAVAVCRKWQLHSQGSALG